jgi:AhpD family alkylhydroperoxidase
MRGPSDWSVGDRELMAAYVSKVNESAFCVGAHTATARGAYQDGPRVAAVLADLESAPIEDGLRATLRMLGKPTAEGKLTAEDMREVLAAGVSPRQIEDALAVCAAFNIIDRLADAFGFELLSPEGYEAGAKYLLKRGYR